MTNCYKRMEIFVLKKGKPARETCGLKGRREQGMGVFTHRGPVTCMQALMGFMVGVRGVFGVVVSPVLGACIPVISKLVLGCAETEPPKSHIHHLGLAGHNSLVGNSCSCRVIHLDRTFRLGPIHGDEGSTVGNHFTCHDEKCC